MQLTCPSCHALFSIESALEDISARAALVTALKFPPALAEPLMGYVNLFRPAKQALSWRRAAKLLNELSALIRAGQIERRGRTWLAPSANWQAAFEQMLTRRAKLVLPLTNHGYLFEILVGMADRVESQAEHKREDALQRRTEHQPIGARQGLRTLGDLYREAKGK